MKLQNLFLAVATLFLVQVTTVALADTVLIDWSVAAPVTNPGTNGNYWNSTSSLTNTNLISSTNTPTPWDVNVSFAGGSSVGFGGTGIAGPSGTNPFDEPAAVVDGIFSNRITGVATISFLDLVPNTAYDFSAIGGRISSGADGLIDVVTGIGTAGNLLNDGTVLDFSVISNGAGIVAFTYREGPFESSNAADSSTFNALIITSPVTPVPEPGALALAVLGAVGLVFYVRRRASTDAVRR